uniref:centrosomal P4.1-associated protein n=1 Tax=Centroberyx gerrardi TaxID=166262 RepID=UPI003AAC4B3A
MSSPAGLQYSQADFLARWMPSSSRAGVILNPSPDLAGSLRHMSALGSPPRDPDDSFTSDFAPLPASTNSSCLSVHGLSGPPGGERSMSDRPVNGLYSAPPTSSAGELDSLEEVASTSQDAPLMMKLEQLRQWQQHMQEQLKAHQLEELLHLQEEQQRLLGMMNGSQHCGGGYTEGSGLSGAEWGEDTLQGASPHRESLHSPTTNSHGVPQGSACGPRQEPRSPQAGRRGQIQRGQDQEEVGDQTEDTWSSREDEQEQSVDASRYQELDTTLGPHNGFATTEDHSRDEDKVSLDRPIKPGISGHKQTFEELLEEQLRLEEQRVKAAQQQKNQDGDAGLRAPPKRAFLKRGEGLSRFTNNRKASLPMKEVKKDPKPQPQARVMTRSNSEPAAFQKGSVNSSQRLPVQRKTAILNKENRLRDRCSPPQDIRADGKAARAKVLGSHQRQNTGVESVQTVQTKRHQEQSSRKAGQSAQTERKAGPRAAPPNAVTKQVGVSAVPGKAENDAAREKRRLNSAEGRTGSEEVGEGGRGEVPEYSFESSFQEKLQRWDGDRQMENMELGEFELLEQAAEELSFSSTSSFVVKVLQMDQQHRQLQAAKGLHERRLSSTPIKSPKPSPPAALHRCNSSGRSGSSSSSSVGVTCKSNSSDSEALVDEEEEEEDGSEGKDETSDVSSCCSSEFGDQEAVVEPPMFPGALCFPAPSNPPYDKRSYQDQDSCRETGSDVTGRDGEESDGVLSDPDDSTLMEDRDHQQGRLVFDDDDTWNDLEDAAGGPPNDSGGASPVSKATGFSPPERALMRKVAVSKGVELDKGVAVSLANQEPDSPLPASQLMARLFPSLKPKAQNAPLPPAAAPEPRKAEEAPGQQVQSRQLRERLVELEIEIERFKKENAALAKLRQENEKNQENLRRECVEFEQVKAEQLSRFEEYKKEESRKLQKERKVFEKHASAARAMPDKKEREEIQALKQQLGSLQEELRRRETRWSSTHSRLRQQIDSLSQENTSLRDEVRTLETLRLSSWKKNHADAEKDKEKKEGPKMFESSGPSATKGVKFASPLDSSSSSSPPQSCSAAATRGSQRDNSLAAAGMKSSLRKPAGPGSSSSSSARRASAPGSSQEHTHNTHHTPPTRASFQSDPEFSEAKEPESNQEVITHPDGKTEKVLAGGGRLVVFPNGTRKELSADGLTAKVTFFNGDTKQVMADQRVIYYYADAQTTHTTYPDGMEVLHFPNNQTEKHFPDGRKEITFPDQTVKNLFPDGREESVLTDGTIIQVNLDGSKEIQFNTGQKEIHTADYKRREYPDGTVKTVYTDGRQETRYPTGRLRVKDKDGNVIADNRL